MEFIIKHGALIIVSLGSLLGVCLGSFIAWLFGRPRPNLVWNCSGFVNSGNELYLRIELINMGSKSVYVRDVLVNDKSFKDRGENSMLESFTGNIATDVPIPVPHGGVKWNCRLKYGDETPPKNAIIRLILEGTKNSSFKLKNIKVISE